MISAVAFACVSSDGVAVSGIEFTPELKASLGLSALGSLIGRPLDEDAIGTPSSNAVKQHLQRVHTTAARIELPPLSVKRNRALCEITDVLINFDCLGVCFHEFDDPGDAEFRTNTRDKSSTALTAPLTTAPFAMKELRTDTVLQLTIRRLVLSRRIRTIFCVTAGHLVVIVFSGSSRDIRSGQLCW
jgi:hypothetical protein